MSNATEIKHYTNFPVCGFCMNAWDIVYGRMRAHTSPMTFLSFCRHGGCDPDIWEHIDEGTGWPDKWKLNDKGLPQWWFEKAPKNVKIPVTDNRVYHLRADSDSHAPWRNVMPRLMREWQARIAKRKGIDLNGNDLEWDEAMYDDDEEPGPVVPAKPVKAASKKAAPTPAPAPAADWSDDDDLWD